MTKWHEVPLGDVITLQRGFDLPAYERSEGVVPIVTSSGITGTHSEAKVKAPGVVMGRYGTLGQPYYLTQDFWPHNTTLYVRDFKGSDPRFIYYLLRTLNFEAHNDKSSVPGLNRNHLHLISVKIPIDIQEQRAIAAILGSIDDKIELNRRETEILEAMARAFFKSWFVDFDPVHAKMERRQPSGMDDEIALLFPDNFEESASTLIPSGWRFGLLDEVIGINERSISRDYPYEEFEYIDISSVSEGRLEGTTIFRLTEAPSRARRLVQHGDTIWSMVRPNRRSYVMRRKNWTDFGSL